MNTKTYQGIGAGFLLLGLLWILADIISGTQAAAANVKFEETGLGKFIAPIEKVVPSIGILLAVAGGITLAMNGVRVKH